MSKTWDLRQRTMDFAVAIFKFCRTLAGNDEARDIARQLRRAASSVAANCRAMRRSQSDGVFASKAAVVIEEADETGFWLELLVNVGLIRTEVVVDLRSEADELVAIFTASRRTIRTRMTKKLRTRNSELRMKKRQTAEF